MAVDKQKVVNLLSAGISPGTIAQTLNCDPSYISQLINDPEVIEAVVAKRVAVATKVAETDVKVQDIRSTLINQMGKIAGMTTKMSDICMALTTIDKMASRLPSANIREEAQTKTTVNLTLPKSLALNFVMNGQNQIVEVDGRVIETMSANRVFDQLNKSITDKSESYGKIEVDANGPRALTAADL